MITSAKNYTKNKKTKNQNKTDKQNPRTNGKSKAIQTKSHKEAYIYTVTKREKGKIYLSIYLYIYIKEESNKSINKLPMIINFKY